MVLSLTLSVFAFSAQDTYAASGTKYIAHRGWSSKAPENTLPAFKLAAKNKKFYGVEFDIWESKAQKSGDPLLLVMHDENIKRMCGVSKNVRNITRASRKKYTIKSGKNIKNYKSLKIPTAELALNKIWKYSEGAIPVIELKHRLSSRALKHLFDLIGNHKVAIISFNYDAVNDAVKLAKKRGVSLVIAGAGGAAHLPGMAAAPAPPCMQPPRPPCSATPAPWPRNWVPRVSA